MRRASTGVTKIRRRQGRRRRRWIEPRRDAAVREVAVVAREIELRIERPALAAGRAVDRPYAAERRRDVEDAIHEDRRRFVPRLRASDAVVPRSIRPGWRQRGDIGARDLVGRRVFRAARVPGVCGPLDRSRVRRGGRRSPPPRPPSDQNATQASTHCAEAYVRVVQGVVRTFARAKHARSETLSRTANRR